MTMTNSLKLGLIGMAVNLSVHAQSVTNETCRTTGYFFGLAQATNSVTARPVFAAFNFAGHNLVNLAMGRSLTSTNNPNQVLAMTFACDLSSADLVVYDKQASNVVANIASSVSVDSIDQQTANAKIGERSHFVAALQINPVGNSTNGLAGGYFTIAGRVSRNLTNGCPQPIVINLDTDSLDRVSGNSEVPAALDKDSTPVTQRAGLAHLMGVVDAVTNGNTNTVLVPYGLLSVRRILPTAPLEP